MPLLPILLLLIPILEVYVLVQVGQEIGFFATLLLIIFSAVLGLQLMRSQGMSTLQRAQQSLMRGEAPTRVLLEGGMIWLSGALLLIPGLISDVFAILLLLPNLRAVLSGWVTRHPPRPRRPVEQAPPEQEPFSPPQPPPPRKGETIDGEYWREDDK